MEAVREYHQSEGPPPFGYRVVGQLHRDEGPEGKAVAQIRELTEKQNMSREDILKLFVALDVVSPGDAGWTADAILQVQQAEGLAIAHTLTPCEDCGEDIQVGSSKKRFCGKCAEQHVRDNQKKYAQVQRERAQKEREKLSDSYLRAQCDGPANEVTSQMIELKRASITNFRAMQESREAANA